MNAALIVPTPKHLEEFFARIGATRGRVGIALDATGSRQPTWDVAAQTTSQMFSAVAGLDVQLIHYRGINEFVASRWFTDPKSLTDAMSRIMCRAGETQIGKVLVHARKENEVERIAALVVISDACEERPSELFAAARKLGKVPVFMFQEGSNRSVAEIYAEIARITGGAVAKFDANAGQRLADLLRAVAVFATGGVKALVNQNSDAARLLLTQLKK